MYLALQSNMTCKQLFYTFYSNKLKTFWSLRINVSTLSIQKYHLLSFLTCAPAPLMDYSALKCKLPQTYALFKKLFQRSNIIWSLLIYLDLVKIICNLDSLDELIDNKLKVFFTRKQVPKNCSVTNMRFAFSKWLFQNLNFYINYLSFIIFFCSLPT